MNPIDDRTFDAWTIANLLAAADNIMSNLDRKRSDGTRNEELDQAAALVRVGAEMTKALVAGIDALPRPEMARSAA